MTEKPLKNVPLDLVRHMNRVAETMKFNEKTPEEARDFIAKLLEESGLLGQDRVIARTKH